MYIPVYTCQTFGNFFGADNLANFKDTKPYKTDVSFSHPHFILHMKKSKVLFVNLVITRSGCPNKSVIHVKNNWFYV